MLITSASSFSIIHWVNFSAYLSFFFLKSYEAKLTVSMPVITKTQIIMNSVYLESL